MRIMLTFLSIFLLLSHLAPWSVEAQEKPVQPLKLILFTKPSPLILGETRGFFAAEGIRIEPTMTRNSVEQIRGILSGTWDLAQTATDNVIAYVESEGADLTIFAGIERGLGITLFVRPEITSFSGLKGKRLGVDALTTGFTFILRKMLLVNGLDHNKKDYELVAVGGTAQRFKALQEGTVAGCLLNVPFDAQAKKVGLVPLISAKDIFENFMSTVWVGRKSWAQKRSDALVCYLRAYIRSVEWLTNPANRAEAAEMLAQGEGISQEAAFIRLSRELDPMTGTIPKSAVDLKGLEAVAKLRAEMGYLKTPIPPLEKYYSLSYYKKAINQ